MTARSYKMMSEDSDNSLMRIGNCRNLAEELLREMPDMKDEIEKTLSEVENENETMENAGPTETPLPVIREGPPKNTLDELKRFRIHRKREPDDGSRSAALIQAPPVKQYKVESLVTEHKSIIEIRLNHVKSDLKTSEELQELERLRKLREQAIIEMDKLTRVDEQLANGQEILTQQRKQEVRAVNVEAPVEVEKVRKMEKYAMEQPTADLKKMEEKEMNKKVVQNEENEFTVEIENQICVDKHEDQEAQVTSNNEIAIASQDINGELDEAVEKEITVEKADIVMNARKEETEDLQVNVLESENKTQINATETVQPNASEEIAAKNDETKAHTDIFSENSHFNAKFQCSTDKEKDIPASDSVAADQLQTNVLDAPDENSQSSINDYDHQQPAQLTAEEEARDQEVRASQTTFVQHLPCFKLQQHRDEDGKPLIPRCRECRRRNVTPQTSSNDVYCRFYEFRRLQYNAAGELLVDGFPNPYTEPNREDKNIWQPDENTAPTAGEMDIQVCRYILLHAGDQFCYLWRQEAEALKMHENPNSTIAWKKVVQGIREICDVCDTTLFNYHWTCDKCGFGVCIDCVKDRKEQRTCRKKRSANNKPQRGYDESHWLLCTASSPHQKHELRNLMLTQIIAGDALNVLGRLLHDVRALWQVPQVCGCLLSKQQLPAESELSELIQDMIKESQLKQQTSASSLATEETLRKQARMEQLHSKKLEFARAKGIDYVPGRVWTKQTLGKDPITSAFDNFKHINFLRKGLAGLRRFLPPRAMTLAHSTLLAPGVPHEWLCDGKLLRLTNAMHPDNRILFQEVWKCGQPVMISEVARSLNLDLWRPEAFCRDFGDKPNDLINCLNGNLVPNQPMRHFWEGFQVMRKRLLDANGRPMLLKLKDWPPGDDFAEILPTRYSDLMKGLPMPEYTLRTGHLNIASCLPKMFVPPDLGPKMYNAYGSAFHPDKGTTNLHLDISDAVNIMVYVGIPQDSDSKSQLVATQRAIAMGGCEYITRARSQSPDVLPGALWHIFPARDADKIRDLLNRVTLEKGFRLEPDHDPIHDQNWYLDDKLRARLFREYGVEGYPIVQCLGDAIFIPAGAPHQVQNLHNCIKVAEDFVSPENITHCYHLTHEFRRLSHSHTNHEDKLQIKNIIYHAIKDCCNILMCALNKRIDAELEKQSQLQAKLQMRATDAVEFITNFTSEQASPTADCIKST